MMPSTYCARVCTFDIAVIYVSSHSDVAMQCCNSVVDCAKVDDEDQQTFEDEDGEVDVAVDVGTVFNVSIVKGDESFVYAPPLPQPTLTPSFPPQPY